MGIFPLEPVDEHARLSVIAFLDVRDLGRYACCSGVASRDAGVEFVWADLFDRTQRPRGSLPREVRVQAARPYGTEAIGFWVSVFYPELNACLAGTVKGYRPTTNEYLVRYAAPRPGDQAREAWELEARTDSAARSNPTLASRSRICFLQPPGGATSEQSVRPAACSTPGQGRGRPHRFSTWREELRHVVAHTPSRVLTRLEHHSDEVLFASFSPCGRRLATCSRDCTTCIYSFGQDGLPALEAVLQHSSAVAHVQWCPDLLFDYIAVSTDGPTLPMAEVWDAGRRECLLRVVSPVRDVYGSIVRWPAGGLALVASGSLSLEGEYVQELLAHAIPRPGPGTGRPEQTRGGRRVGGVSSQTPLARLLLRGALNYFHCLEPAANAGGPEGRFAALSGTGPRQCDVVALLDLPSAEDLQGGGSLHGAVFELAPRARELRGHGVLSVRWAQGGRLLLVNARPRVEGCCELPSAGETMARAMRRPAPPLRTAFELLVLDASTLETLSVHVGHHAFTTADAPFIVHADAWANTDIVASGGEDACVHVWHRSHGHQVARLEAHTHAVNAVTWSQTLRLMISASDDHTVVVWSCRAA